MSLKSAKAGTLALASAATVAALSAPGAQAAQTATLNYKCKFPLIGTQPVQLETAFDVPATWPVSEVTPPWPVMATVSLSSSIPEALEGFAGLRTLGAVTEAQKPGKSSGLRTRVSLPDGTGLNVRIPIDFTPYTTTGPLLRPLPISGQGSMPSLTLDVPGPAKIALTELILNLYAYGADGQPLPGLRTPPIDVDGDPRYDSDGDPNTFDVHCKLDPAGQNLQLAEFELLPVDPPENQPPTQPGIPTAGSVTPTSLVLRWDPSTDSDGTIAQYNLYQGDTKIAEVKDGTTTWSLSELSPDTAYDFSVEAVDDQGAVGPRSAVGTVQTKPAPSPVCSEDLTVTGIANPGSVTLSWTAPAGSTAVSYDVYIGTATTPSASVPGTTATIPNLIPGVSLPFRVVGRDAAGNRCGQGSVTVKTKPAETGTVDYAYALKGSTTLKTLTKGTLGLSGSIAAKLKLADGSFEADLTLADTSGRLVAAGFLPVTAKVGFAPSGKTTGSLVDGVLKTNSKVRIKVKEVKLFGAIPLAGGNNCQTKQLSDINLQSTQPEFSPLVGGPIAGTYKISDLNGCGPLGGLVSPLTAGGGNTIALNLTPAA